MEKQIYKGKLVWVGFLEHQGFFKWLSNRTTAGYVVVSASDPSDAYIVTDKKVKYLQSGWFMSDIGRAAWLSAPTELMTDYTPCIDPSGNPVWVITTYKNTVGFGGGEASGVLLLDAQTGESTKYGMTDVPAWVNRIQPASLVRQQAEWYGSYIHGWLNDTFSGKDVVTVSGDIDLLYSDNGDAYWFVAMTSKGADNGITGYYLIDSRTKQAFFTQIAGANDDVAKEAVFGLVREKAYHATSPLIFDVLGKPTYVMAMTDNTGITRGYGLVNVANYQVAVFGQTLIDAARQYANKLDRSSNAVDSFVKSATVTGQLLRIGADVRNGNTTYFLVVNGVKQILTGTSDISAELPVAAKGDVVNVTYMAGEQSTAPLSAFAKK